MMDPHRIARGGGLNPAIYEPDVLDRVVEQEAGPPRRVPTEGEGLALDRAGPVHEVPPLDLVDRGDLGILLGPHLVLLDLGPTHADDVEGLPQDRLELDPIRPLYVVAELDDELVAGDRDTR